MVLASGRIDTLDSETECKCMWWRHVTLKCVLLSLSVVKLKTAESSLGVNCRDELYRGQDNFTRV